MAAHLTLTKRLRHQLPCSQLATARGRAPQHKLFSNGGSQLHSTDRKQAPQNELAREKLAAREFFLSILSSAATKRDAKTYLSRYKPTTQKRLDPILKTQPSAEKATKPEDHHNWRLHNSGVNLGSLYIYPTAIEQSPVFRQEPVLEKLAVGVTEPLHLAIVKITAPQTLNDQVIDGVSITLCQLASLGLLSAVVVDCATTDCSGEDIESTREWRDLVISQADRLATSINGHRKKGARVVAQALSVSPAQPAIPHVVPVRGRLSVRPKSLLFSPLDNGRIAILPPIAYTGDSKIRTVKADDVIIALTREFAGLSSSSSQTQDDRTAAFTDHIRHPVSLDRVIVLDPLGGLPSKHVTSGVQVFVNLEQEYDDVREELVYGGMARVTASHSSKRRERTSAFRSNDPFSSFKEDQAANKQRAGRSATDPCNHPFIDPLLTNRYVDNLDLIQRALSLLPPSSSALLTTAAEAAGSAHVTTNMESTTGVGTRLKRNPLIHNLLTDKPLISSSLPAARVQQSPEKAPMAPATFFKRGMPLTIIPDPRVQPWRPNSANIVLESDPRIDFPRLQHLIEDSFGRPLNVHHYLSRIAGRIAGVIIAGEYEGGAILTWEAPPSDPSRPLVPYLDKFAVLRRSQGSGGVADIIFNAMVRRCFPEGVVWRSRNNNPVNKWYFERANGTWRLPGATWCMFWTGNELDFGPDGSDQRIESLSRLSEKQKRWKDYVDVCAGIEASWADKDKPPD